MKEIRLTRGKVAIVDDSDYENLIKYKWQARLQVYTGLYRAKRVGNPTEIDMARQIMNCPVGLEVDHINGDLLDNRRCNLRICTHSENMRNRKLQKNNTSGYRGVTYVHGSERYTAQIYRHKKKVHLGTFDTAELAAIAYNEAAKHYYGEFAKLNLV